MAIDSLKINELNLLIISSNINSVPDQKEIKTWRQGFDGITYIIETTIINEYYLKTYWTPTAQEEVEEAAIVNKFVHDISLIVNAPEQWKEFITTIPYECYMASSSTVSCKILTLSAKRRMRKERNIYRRKQVK